MSAVEKENVNVIDSLIVVFNALRNDKVTQREIDEQLAVLYKIPRGTIDEIFINTTKLDELTQDELVVLCVVVHKITKNEMINPFAFYSQKSVSKALKYRYEEDSLEFPYVLEGVIRSSNKEFITVMSYKDIAKLWNSKFLTYNFQTQRAAKKKINAKGEIKRTPTVIQKSVKNITRLMLEGKFLLSTLVFNILADGTDSIQYDNGDLIIDEGTQLNLIDGMHRLQGILNVIEQNPDFEGYMEVSIRHYTLNEARYLIGLLNTVNRFDKNLVKFNTDDSIGGLIVKDLITIKELRDRVETESTAVKKTLKMLTNYSVLSDSINTVFEPQTTKDQYDITDTLKKFFGYLISAYPDDFTNKMNEARKVSWLNHHNMFVGFIVIAKKLYDKYEGVNFPVSEITRIIESIDMRKGSGNALDLIMIEQGNRNSNQSKSLIRKFFEEQVDKIIE